MEEPYQQKMGSSRIVMGEIMAQLVPTHSQSYTDEDPKN